MVNATTWFGRTKLQVFGALSVALIFAFLAFANALSFVGLPFEPLRRVGSSFYAADTSGRLLGRQFIVASQKKLVDAQRSALERKGIKLPPMATDEAIAPSSDALRNAALAMIARNTYDSAGATIGSFALYQANETHRADQLMAISRRLSRRDQTANLWLMQQSMNRGNNGNAVKELDVMLRSVGNPPIELFMQIVPLLETSDGFAALANVARGNPNWLSAFYEAGVAYARNPATVARFMLQAGRQLPQSQRMAPVYSSLLERLVGNGAVREIRSLYPLLPGSRPDDLTSPGALLGATSSYPFVNWQITQVEGFSGSIIAEGADSRFGYLELYADPGRNGIAASKIFVSPKSRTLSGQVLATGNLGGSHGQLVVHCLGVSGRPSVSELPLGEKLSTFTLPLPDQCPMTRLDVVLAAGTASEPLRVELHKLTVR